MAEQDTRGTPVLQFCWKCTNLSCESNWSTHDIITKFTWHILYISQCTSNGKDVIILLTYHTSVISIRASSSTICMIFEIYTLELQHKCIPQGKYFSRAKVAFKLLTSCPLKHFREGTCQKPMLIFIEKKRRNNIVLKNLWNKLSMKVRVCCWEEISKISGGQVTHWHLSCKLRQSRKSILWYICFGQKSYF